MEKLTQCPICKESNFTELFTCKDYVATGETFNIVKCQKCSHEFTNARPTEIECGKYYQSNNYISHSGTDKSKLGFTYKLYDIVRNYSIGLKLNIIKKYQKSGELLDLGCGLGYFLNGAKQEGTFHCQGADISEDAIKYVKENFNIEVKKDSDLKSFKEGQFKVITQWHVLEHVYRLEDRLKELKYLLAKNGTMFIAVPNSDSWDAKNYKAHWDGYDVPRHIHHFNKKSIKKLFEENGFKIIKMQGMWFDAPYISMRSEYHKGNTKLGFIFGAIKGIYSNFLALFTGNQSSILLIIQHQ
ncbi:MAG: class I SAM-dependent methyltransferase [Bacteroidia bacterium]